MSDLKLTWNDKKAIFDLEMLPDLSDLATDEGLQTAVIVSLFTDARAEPVELPPGETDLRGWFGEAFGDLTGDRIGSKLWLLEREKQTEEVRMRAIEYAREALQWMIEDGVAESIDVDCQFPDRGIWQLAIAIKRPGVAQAFKYSSAWRAALAN